MLYFRIGGDSSLSPLRHNSASEYNFTSDSEKSDVKVENAVSIPAIWPNNLAKWLRCLSFIIHLFSLLNLKKTFLIQTSVIPFTKFENDLLTKENIFLDWSSVSLPCFGYTFCLLRNQKTVQTNCFDLSFCFFSSLIFKLVLEFQIFWLWVHFDKRQQLSNAYLSDIVCLI